MCLSLNIFLSFSGNITTKCTNQILHSFYQFVVYLLQFRRAG